MRKYFTGNTHFHGKYSLFEKAFLPSATVTWCCENVSQEEFDGFKAPFVTFERSEQSMLFQDIGYTLFQAVTCCFRTFHTYIGSLDEFAKLPC